MKEYRNRNKEYRKVWHRRYVLKLKNEILSHYSAGPAHCALHHNYFPLDKPVKDIRALTIDHINGDGYKQRKKLGNALSSGHPFYRWIKKNGYPKGYQVLCMNCQFIKRIENKENRKSAA